MNIIKKDITTVTEGVLINGVNCQQVMGSGVAKAYFTKWPQVREQYLIWGKNQVKLGKFDHVRIEQDKLYVANCWTQEYFGADGKMYADRDAILHSVTKAATFAKEKGLEIYTPWVGCGLGGLEQAIIKETLEVIERFTRVPITVCEI